MITQHRFSVQFTDRSTLPVSVSYPLYSWLLSQMPGAYADMLHQQGEKPVSQYLRREQDKTIWTVSCLNLDAASVLQPILERVSAIPLHSGLMKAELMDVRNVHSLEDLTSQAREKIHGPYCRMVFATPTSFKHNGRYVILPEVRLLLRSLAEKWKSSFPDYPLEDTETMDAIEQSLSVMDYRLRSCRFPLKGVQIPGFEGQVSLYSDLPAPLMDVWKSLAYYAEFSGAGMKTTLGMGGIYLQTESRKSR